MTSFTPSELHDFAGATLPDIIAPDLDILFCGINPGLYSAATGHHFARPGNRFWPALHASGLTPRLLLPSEDALLPEYGLGLTNFIQRASANATELRPEEFTEGAKRLEAMVDQYKPKWLAVLGIGAYRLGFGEKKAIAGPQQRTIGSTKIWLLPNPSGLNAHYTPQKIAQALADLKEQL